MNINTLPDISYNKDELKTILTQCVENERRHCDYEYTVGLAEIYRKYLIGKKQDDLIVSYKQRESDAQKEQRVRITKTRTPYICNLIVQPFEEIARAEDFKESIKFKSDNSKAVEEIENRLSNFSGGYDLRTYLNKAFKHFNFHDPNAFFIVDFINKNPEKEKPVVFPKVATSSNVLDFEYYNSDLQYLVIREPVFIKQTNNYSKFNPNSIKAIDVLLDKSGEIIEPQQKAPYGYEFGWKYILYGPNICLVYEQTNLQVDNGRVSIELSNNTRFFYEEFNTLSKITPAMRFGYLEDPETELRTFVNPFNCIRSLLDDAIQRKSEIDLHLALHGFLQKYTYGRTCNNKSESDGFCREGIMTKSRNQCSVCNGKGKTLHISVQDVTIVPIPDSDAIPPIKDLVHYVPVPTELIKLQKENLKDIENDILRGVFNTKIFENSSVQRTATELILDKIPVNNVLKEAADHQAVLMKLATIMTAIHTKNDEGFECDYSYGGDFRLETVDELLKQRQAAISANAPGEIIQNIDAKILSKQVGANIVKRSRIEARQRWKPFRDRTVAEVNLLLTMIDSDSDMYVMYVFYERIMDEIELENKNPEFYQLAYPLQKSKIEEKINLYRQYIKPPIQLPS